MSTITERFHDKRLKKFNINIKTKFQDGEIPTTLIMMI